ncbi:hypothetical protein HAX54_018956 [Datura stramonium]|uniref:Uncharacterized protein n=1 Tax=Datura stramonium TaxID=4076 RepID=A0ABS8UQG0_DATST|nr:hypothetical protein [Datura stramonium]
MSGFPLNLGEIIDEEINWRVVKLSTAHPFPCLITWLCKEAHVPIFAGIDVKTYATKNVQIARAAERTTEPAIEATGAELVCHASPIPTSTPSTSAVAATQSGVESAKTLSSMPQALQYAFTPANFARVFRKKDRQEKQLKPFAE